MKIDSRKRSIQIKPNRSSNKNKKKINRNEKYVKLKTPTLISRSESNQFVEIIVKKSKLERKRESDILLSRVSLEANDQGKTLRETMFVLILNSDRFLISVRERSGTGFELRAVNETRIVRFQNCPRGLVRQKCKRVV